MSGTYVYYHTYKERKRKTSNDKNNNNNYKKIPYISVNVSTTFFIELN